VECGHIDLKGLERDRDQLLAEALKCFLEGQSWWPATAEEIRLCSAEQAERYVTDEWESVIRSEIVGKEEITVRWVLERIFGFSNGRKDWSKSHEMRVAKCLKHMGLKKVKRASTNVWLIKDMDTPGHPGTVFLKP
jgi:putative DNA primase/helicase